MKELTLEHLAGYLPYGLNCKAVCDLEIQTDFDAFEIVDEKGIIIVLDFIYKEMCGYSVSRDEYYKYSNHFNKDVFNSIKPILRPLSDLTKNILDDGNELNYELFCELSELLNTNDCRNFVNALINNHYYAIDIRLLNDVEQFLYKNNFDWKLSTG